MGSMVEVDRMVNVSHVVVLAAGMVWMMCKGVMGMTVVSARWRLVVLMRYIECRVRRYRYSPYMVVMMMLLMTRMSMGFCRAGHRSRVDRTPGGIEVHSIGRVRRIGRVHSFGRPANTSGRSSMYRDGTEDDDDESHDS